MTWYALARRRGKYNARAAKYNGQRYHSKREAEYAAELDLRVRAGELKSWRRQVKMPIVVNGSRICSYTIDFVETPPSGDEIYTEIKGFETPEWKLKWKLFEVVYPALKKQVIK